MHRITYSFFLVFLLTGTALALDANDILRQVDANMQPQS